MKAIVVTDQAAGTAGMTLAERPEPTPAINDVVVQIHASGWVPTELDWPSTWIDRAGRDRTPSIPGHELAGVVVSLGYGTTGLSVGQRVFGLADWHRDGTLAEYVAIEARNLAPLPDDIDFAGAASLPISALTAWQGLFDHGRLESGQRVLAHGAAGAVGSLVTQLAAETGAHVIGSGRAADRDRVLGFGAQEFVDLDNESLTDVGEVDLVFDVIGGLVQQQSAALIKSGGTLVSVVGPVEAQPADGRAVDFVVEADRAQLLEIGARVADGRLRPNVGLTVSFDEAVATFNSTQRLKGKTVVTIRSCGPTTVSCVDLIDRIRDRGSEFLLFAITPPRLATPSDRVQEIANTTLGRLAPLGLDGLILYDIDDEADRNSTERPFPFMPTIDPARYLDSYLRGWATPAIVYRSVSKYDGAELRHWFGSQDSSRVMTVLVGAASSGMQNVTSLRQAQSLRAETNPALTLGGVAIPERHGTRGDEHTRLLGKQESGCSFFVTQVVYDINAAKNLVSDYHYECAARGVEPVPLVFTLSVCGSMKTLEFMRWLGVAVPRWIENDLKHATDTLDASYLQAIAIATELIAFCRALGMPFGINVESVSNRQVEIEASVRLAAELRDKLRR